MKIDRSITLLPAAILLVGALAACGDTEPPKAPAVTTTPAVTIAPSPVTTPPDATPTEEPGTSQASQGAQVPDVVSMNHADALATLHEAGFIVNEEDASPEGRWIVANSNWQVCSQDPEPGATNVLRVTIYSVKLNESC